MHNFVFFFLKRAPKFEQASDPTQSGSAPGKRNVEWRASCDHRGYVNYVCTMKVQGILKVKNAVLKTVHYVRKYAIGILAIVSIQDRFHRP
jgi:hypothetical protein